MTHHTRRVLGTLALALSFLFATPAIANGQQGRAAKGQTVKRAQTKAVTKQKQTKQAAKSKAAAQLRKADRRQAKRAQRKAQRAKQRRNTYGIRGKQTPKALERRLLRLGEQARFAPSLDSW